MRRNEREITDRNEIVGILRECDVIRVGFFDEEYPYIVPLSFGINEEGGKIFLYFHCATEGKKVSLLKKNDRVCVEADVFGGYKSSGLETTTAYKSVIGFGKAEKCDGEEKVIGLDLIMRHCGYSPERELLLTCAAFETTAVFKIELEEITGKKNLL